MSESQETKYSIGDNHVWADEIEPDTKDQLPAAEVESHAVEILHRGHGRPNSEQDIRYRYVFDGGKAIGILRSHRLAESNQFDPAGAAAPHQVPSAVRQLVADEMGVDHWTDVVDVKQAEKFAEVGKR
jgi:hypothetical protein